MILFILADRDLDTYKGSAIELESHDKRTSDPVYVTADTMFPYVPPPHFISCCRHVEQNIRTGIDLNRDTAYIQSPNQGRDEGIEEGWEEVGKQGCCVIL